MATYIYDLPNWPRFVWDHELIASMLGSARYSQGKFIGKMESLGFELQANASLETLTLDVLKTSEIEGESLNAQEVKSSVARRLGMDIAGLIPADRSVEGIVEVIIDATQNYLEPLTEERLFGWNAALFPTGRSGMQKIVAGAWRNNSKDDPMQVISGAMGKERIHFQAPDADLVESEMKRFMSWFNEDDSMDAVLKAAIAHFWFVTIHPFEDGNGRIARAIADMHLARADGTSQRFYSMSAQIRKERNDYYEILERSQKGTLDITRWLSWFLQCLDRAILKTDETLAAILKKAAFWERNRNVDLNNRQKLLLNMLFDGFEGKLNTSKWAKIAKTSTDTALRDIQDLIDKQILAKEPGGGRSTAYVLTL